MNDALTQFLIDVTRGRLRASFRADPEATLTASGLEPQLQLAIREENVGALWRAQAHPMALLYFARLCGWPAERYYACVGEAESFVGK